MKVVNMVCLIMISLVVFSKSTTNNDAIYEPEAFTKEDVKEVRQAFGKLVKEGKERFAELWPKAEEEEEEVENVNVPVVAEETTEYVEDPQMAQVAQALDEYIDTVKEVYEVMPSALTYQTIAVVVNDPAYREKSLKYIEEQIEMDEVTPEEISRAFKKATRNILKVAVENVDARIENSNILMEDYEQQRAQAHADGYKMLEDVFGRKIVQEDKIVDRLKQKKVDLQEDLEAIRAEQE